ncbi:MAG: NUDIX hydrolase [Xanthomonadales bacterium PRO6]|nr:Phosphatase NudJ [Xanthomonadales bacterium]MCE7929838.1 NUDIX hydrolase [Xanthomonadales bacterium PRO6]
MNSPRLPRVTVAAIIPERGRFLLVEELIDGRAVLNQPAGHLDEGEGLIEAVVRETREETAWTVRPLALVGIHQLQLPQLQFVRVAFLCEAVAHDPAVSLDPEIVRTHWLSRDEIAAHTIPTRSPLVLQCIDEYLAGRQWPLDVVSAVLRP